MSAEAFAESIPPGYKQTEVGIIPEDWEVCQLGDCIKLSSGHHVLAKYCNTDGDGIAYITGPADFPNGTIQQTKFTTKPGIICCADDILITVKGSGAGTIVLSNQEYCISRQLMAIHVHSCSKNYAYYSLLLDSSLFSGAATGLIPGLSRTDILQKLISLPPTVAEQEAIATALSDTDALIESLEQLIAKKRQTKQGAMQELLTRKRRLPGYSEEWGTKLLGNTAVLKARIGWQGLTTNEYLDSGDYYLVTGTEFKDGYIDWGNCHYVTESRYKQDKNIQVKEHDVLVTKDGTIGKVALINHLHKSATLNSGVFVIRPIEDAFHPEFFYYLLCSNIFTEFLAQLSAGSTINHLYQKDFVNFIYKTPVTIEEQAAIANILSDMDSEITTLEQKLAKTRQIKQGMMQELLTGRIRLIDAKEENE